MAIYHLHAKMISRASGSSAVASAAYRAGLRLHDDRLDRDHDFSNKADVVHSEIMAPEHTPPEFLDREKLWNAVELAEKRKDAQLSREIEFSIPRELTKEQGIDLAREFVRDEFVSKGMIADLNVHWDIGADGLAKPHAHVMLTTRSVDENGLGAKVRDWNKVEHLVNWRDSWAAHANERLAELGIDVRIDHRSYRDQGIELEPQHKVGPAASRMVDDGFDLERVAEHQAIARENGARIIANPDLALDAITKQQATFTRRDLAMFVHRHSDGLEQYNEVLQAVESSPNLIRVGLDGRGDDRFSSREMLQTEERLHNQALVLADRERHTVRDDVAKRALEEAAARRLVLSREQRAAFDHVVGRSDLGVVLGYAGSGKSAMLGVAREAFEEAGYNVRGMALSGIAAENLESGSGIASRTIASHEYHWAQGRELLTDKDVLVIDEAGMVGTRQLERVLREAEKAGAKVVLVGDPEQLQAIDAGAAFRSISERHAHVEVQEIRRQREDWQRNATRHLATGRTAEALDAYQNHDRIHAADSREHARSELVDSWDKDRLAYPDKTRLILTHTNDDVQALNGLARGRLKGNGELGRDVSLQVDRGDRAFASGDRVMFFKNDRGMGVKNGTLGVIEEVTDKHMSVWLDAGKSVQFDLKDYNQVDHGYAATVHKSQGVTVDRTHVLATPGLDRHATYVALSRHRDSVSLYYGQEDFADEGKLTRTLSRERPKDMASDYGREADQVRGPAPVRKPVLDRTPVPTVGPPSVPGRSLFDDLRLTPAKAVERPSTKFGDFKTNIRREQTPAIKAPNPEIAARQVQRDRERAEAQQRARQAEEVTKRRRSVLVQAYAVTEVELDKQSGLAWTQLAAKERAADELNKFAAGSAQDIQAAFDRDPSLVSEAANGQTQRTIRAMQIEAEMRNDPQLRAQRFVDDWKHHDQQRDKFSRSGDDFRAIQHNNKLDDLRDTLRRDPQIDSILLNRKLELKRELERGGHDMGLVEHLGISRRRELGISM